MDSGAQYKDGGTTDVTRTMHFGTPSGKSSSHLLNDKLARPGVAQEGGGGGYHCSTAAGYPKLDSTLEILAVEQVG